MVASMPLREIMRDRIVGVGMAKAPDGLQKIRHRGCSAVIWNRTPPPGFVRWIDCLDPARLPRARVVVPLDEVAATVAALCTESAMPPGEHCDWFIDDVARLALLFAAQMSAAGIDTPFLRLRLDAVTTDSCRRFHVDAVKARLVCTYRGPGTQYGTARGGDAPATVFDVPPCAPILLRGTLWPANPPTGLVHRSPPIAGTGRTRLVLVLDPMSAPVDAF
ncbi:MAG: DUF1826 domain-containing protein [Pseudomonadota bacterium]